MRRTRDDRNGAVGAVYEAGLICRIRRDLERAEALTSRYSEGL